MGWGFCWWVWCLTVSPCYLAVGEKQFAQFDSVRFYTQPASARAAPWQELALGAVSELFPVPVPPTPDSSSATVARAADGSLHLLRGPQFNKTTALGIVVHPSSRVRTFGSAGDDGGFGIVVCGAHGRIWYRCAIPPQLATLDLKVWAQRRYVPHILRCRKILALW